jgi:hypothetical protein
MQGYYYQQSLVLLIKVNIRRIFKNKQAIDFILGCNSLLRLILKYLLTSVFPFYMFYFVGISENNFYKILKGSH